MTRIINHPNNFNSVADIGGNRILGMGGSLSSYIETGNPYSDAYVPNNNPKKKKKNSFKNALIALGTIGSIIGIYYLAFGKKPKAFFNKIGEKLQNLKEKLPFKKK